MIGTVDSFRRPLGQHIGGEIHMDKLWIDRLELANFRCFSNITVDFDEQLTVLVAPNGAGKTSILDAVAITLGPFVGAFDESVSSHAARSDIRLVRARKTKSNEMELALGGARFAARGNVPGRGSSTWQRSLATSTDSRTTVKDAKVLTEYGKQLQDQTRTENGTVILPVVAFYGTGRLWKLKKLINRKLERTSRTVGYTDCLDPGSSYKAFSEWFGYWSTSNMVLQMEAAQRGEPYAPNEFLDYRRSVKRAVDACLTPSGWSDLEFDYGYGELVAKHQEHGVLPVSQLSDGIRNMIGMVADIAFRATKLNPQFGESASLETPGIVLIDEVDMHLHPSWQQTVLGGLRAAFPGIQFIVSTHSPQVLTTVPSKNIRVLHVDESGWHASQPVLSPLGRPAGAALAGIMETHERPQLPILDDIHHYEYLVRNGQESSSEASSLLEDLTSAGADIPPSDLALWRFLQAETSSSNEVEIVSG